MNRSILLPACLALFVSACATTQSDAPPPENEQTSQHAPQHAAPATDWEALRGTLSSALQAIPEAEVRTNPDGLQLRLPVTKGFESGKSAPRPALTRMLDALVPTLAEHPHVAIEIIGHTDSIGSEMSNLKLSISRAEAVMEYLRKQNLGLERMSADGKGELEPIANNGNETGRARNRRVEIYLRDMP